MSDNQTNSADPCASTPGAILRRCREFRGLSIQEAAESTKVAEHHLRALEDDCVTEFANPAYLKGFLRIYSDYLGLNADDMIRLSERLPVSSDDASSGQGRGRRSASRRRRPLPWKKLVLPTALLVVMIVTALLLDHSPPPWQPPPSQPLSVPVAAVQPARSSVTAAAPSEEADSEEESDQSPGHDEAQSETGSAHEAAAESSRGVLVRLRVIHNASLAVTMDGTTIQHYELTGGDTFEWKADRTIALELSDAASVAVELNGRPLRHLGASGAPAYVVLDANGVRQQ